VGVAQYIASKPGFGAQLMCFQLHLLQVKSLSPAVIGEAICKTSWKVTQPGHKQLRESAVTNWHSLEIKALHSHDYTAKGALCAAEAS